MAYEENNIELKYTLEERDRSVFCSTTCPLGAAVSNVIKTDAAAIMDGILEHIRAAQDPRAMGSAWLTNITNGVTNIFRELDSMDYPDGPE